MKTERELFEVEAERLGIQLDKWEDGTYVNKTTYMFLSIWQASASREGYKLAPLKPNKEMISAGSKCWGGAGIVSIYTAMINSI